MSYDIDRIKEIKCPCGKGRVKHVIESNEWNQERENIKIICKECKEKYKITIDYINSKPKHDHTIYYCEDKKDGKKIRLEL